MKPHTFIASSAESLSLAFAVQENLDRDSEVTVWNQGIFDLPRETLDPLFKLLETVDFAGFVFSPDDLKRIGGTETQPMRDNVVFLLMAFTAKIGSERSFIIMPREINVKLPPELTGAKSFTYTDRKDANLRAALAPACVMIRELMRQLGPIGGSVKSAVNELIRDKQPINDDNEVKVPVDLLRQINKQLASLASDKKSPDKKSPDVEFKEKSVFLSYRFVEREYIDGLKSLLERSGFTVVTAERTNTFIGQGILSLIKTCEFFLCLMTKAEEKTDGTYTTSPWLLEEKGAALAYGKKIVMMVEDGVKDIGGLQGDWQRIHFSLKGFTTASLQAVDQLKSYI